jgi:hypothetical protein
MLLLLLLLLLCMMAEAAPASPPPDPPFSPWVAAGFSPHLRRSERNLGRNLEKRLMLREGLIPHTLHRPRSRDSYTKRYSTMAASSSRP